MPDCAQYDQGTNGQVRAFIDGRVPAQPYDTVGWPTFTYWPGPTRQAEEGTYWTSVERAWRGGLRVLVVLFVQNEALCDAMTIRDGAAGILQRHGQRSGAEPGPRGLRGLHRRSVPRPRQGWLRIVNTPAQARKVIEPGQTCRGQGHRALAHPELWRNGRQ